MKNWENLSKWTMPEWMEEFRPFLEKDMFPITCENAMNSGVGAPMYSTIKDRIEFLGALWKDYAICPVDEFPSAITHD